MKKSGFYIIKEKFFEDMNDPYLKGNKESNRPHFYCYEDSCSGVYWMIPLSSRVEKYKRIIDKIEGAGNHMVLANEHIIKEIDQKARKVVAMLKQGVKFTPTQPNVNLILEKLLISSRE